MPKVKCTFGGRGQRQIKGHPRGDRGGGQPHSPSPPLPCGRLRVLGIVASSPFQEDLVLVPSGLWARGSDRGGRCRERPAWGQVVTRSPSRSWSPFRPKTRAWTSLLRRGAEISVHMPACHPGSSPPLSRSCQIFLEGRHVFGLAGCAQDAACSLGRSPSPRSPPAPLPQKGW